MWEEVNIGFDSAEESLNFGTRAVAQSDTDIYETNTVATIRAPNEDLLQEKPQCFSQFTSTGVGVAVDNTWILFDVNFSEIKLKITFESVIETFEISGDGCFLFVALANTQVKCLCLSLEGNLEIFSEEIERPPFFKGSRFYSKIVSKNVENNLVVYVFVNSGKLIRISGIDFNAVREMRNDGNISSIMIDMAKNIQLKCLHTMNEIVCCATLDILKNYKFWLCGDGLYIWSETENHVISVIEIENKLKKISTSYFGDKIIGLDEKGLLVFFCPYTYSVLGVWSKLKIIDFTFITQIMDNSVISQVLLLVESENLELCLYDVNGISLKLVYQLLLDSASCFLVQDQLNCEGIFFIDGYMDNNKINALRIKSIAISHPEFRLTRLLQRGKFMEAENFARIFSLDIESVHKAKIKWIMSRLHLWNKISVETLDENFIELCSLLKEIKDIEFVAECSLKIIAPKLSNIQQVIHYSINRIIASHPTKNDKLQKLLDNLSVSLRTLGTFNLIYSGESASPDRWFIFSTANPISLCKQHLSRGEVKEASIICRRHNRKIKGELAESTAISLFEVLPLSVAVEETISWYDCYIPLLLSVHPYTLARLTRRLIEKAKRLELSNNENWPDVSLFFLTEMINLLEKLLSLDDSSPEGVALHQGKCLPDSPINQLRTMVANLQKLYILKHEHFIHISYDVFATYYGAKDLEEFTQLTSILFENIPIDGISNLITKFVEPYCIEHHKDIDYIISHYISNAVKNYSRYWDIESSVWEMKCIALANFIRNIPEKMKVIEIIVRFAKVPWSVEVNEVAKKSSQIKHPLAQVILEHSNKVSKKIILNKYDLPMEWVDAPRLSPIIPYIYRKGQPEMFNDALELVSANEKLKCYEVYVHYCIQQNQFDNALGVFKHLDRAEISDLSSQIIYSASLYLKSRYHDYAIQYFEILPAISFLKSKNSKEKDCNLVKYIRASYEMKTIYGVDLDASELWKTSVREFGLKKCLEQITEELEQNKSENENNLMKWTRKAKELTKLLNLPSDLGILELALISCAANNLNLANEFLKIIIENCENDIGTSHSVFKTHEHLTKKLIEQLLLNFSNSLEVPSFVINNMCKASELLVIEGSSSNLSSNMDLMNTCNMFYVPPSKPSWSLQYDEPDLSRLILSPRMSENLPQCFGDKTIIEDSSQLLQEEIERTIQEMPKDLLALRRISTFTFLLSKHRMIDMKTVKKAKNIILQTMSPVLLKVIKSRVLDMSLALSLLQLFQPDQAIKWLENVSNISLELRHGRSLGQVGKQFSKLLEISSSAPRENKICFTTLYQTSKWSLKIQQLGLPPKVGYKEDLEGKQYVLMRIMSLPSADLPLLMEYCSDMKLDLEKCLMQYLRYKLLSWKPRFTIVTNSFNGKSVPIIEKDEELFIVCYGIVKYITDHNELISFIKKNVWDQVNPYYYEVYLVIIDLLSNLTKINDCSEQFNQSNSLLHFLKSYIRISPCQESESDSWFSTFPSSTSLPTIAQYRLPFSSVAYDIKKLRPELSLDTYNIWIDAPLRLNSSLDKNTICLFTIYNLKDEEVSTSSSWFLHERKRDLLNSITACIDKISNYEIAVAAWYFVVNHVMPPGIDQVIAAQKCLLKAKEWIEKDKSVVSNKLYEKVEKKCSTVSTVHILCKYRLATPEYLSLVSQPGELILQLYQDPCIIDKFNIAIPTNMPNINEAVERIASLHNIDLTIIVQELLTEWLQPDNSLQSTFVESIPSAAAMNDQLSKSDNIIRACYVLLGCQELRNAENFLVGLAFPRNQDDTSKPIGIRLRALQALIAITSTQHLEEITSRDKDSIGSYMTALALLYELDRHGISYTISSFELASKETVIINLLNRSSAEGIKLACRIALTYNINDSKIWKSLLQQMIEYAMVQELETILPELDYVRINQEILSDAWNCVVLSILARGERVHNDEVKTVIEKSFKLVTSCPTFSLLDLTSIINCYKKLQRADLALILENISRENS